MVDTQSLLCHTFSLILYPIVWIGRLHPLDETWNSARLKRNTIVRDQLGNFNREPLAQT